MYICATDQIGAMVASTRDGSPDYVPFAHTDTFGSTGMTRRGVYTAVDLSTREVAWQQQWNDRCFSGSTVTGGGLVFIGRNDGRLTALNSSNGDMLWEFQTETGIHQSVTVFEHKGKQYVAAFAGGTIYAPNSPGDNVWLFSLEGTMGEFKSDEASTEGRQSPQELLATLPEAEADLAAGGILYDQTCQPCHGETGRGGEGGGAPLTGGLSMAEMLSVVVYGRNNMPAFETAFEAKQLKDVGSYITEVLLPD
jgi:quinohemoprotein ethanol dehydrogenase